MILAGETELFRLCFAYFLYFLQSIQRYSLAGDLTVKNSIKGRNNAAAGFLIG